ncbi:uncharacterized protein LOC130934358 [Arachis stenosperma]|uniref:uncharacterized protein LOC130934358 n=1 Tax=Arachis stenosperma TaxID=217475 RepID=UPI0025ACC4EE|nr:uncharacterized protein LOC130934358 [Arachis stenosperma]
MAALQNMVADMQATAEVNPSKFKGTTNPTEADTWFQAMEHTLQAQLVPKKQCVEFATYLLTGEVSHWWQGTRHLLQHGDDPITWDAFQEEFYKKYFLNSARTAKELELLQLKPGAISVSEYIDKRAPKQYLQFSRAYGDQDFHSKGRVTEECLKKAAAERGSHRESFPLNRGKSFAPRGLPFKWEGFTPQRTQGQNNFRRPNNNNVPGRRFRKQPQNEQMCARCGSYHLGVPCKAG